jgi:hypothetical protein
LDFLKELGDVFIVFNKVFVPKALHPNHKDIAALLSGLLTYLLGFAGPHPPRQYCCQPDLQPGF